MSLFKTARDTRCFVSQR
eukprot:UN08310